MGKLNESMYTSNKDDWETPDWLFDSLNKTFKFELDACANENNFKVKKYFNKTDNCLLKDWSSYSAVWMNPPYGKHIRDFIEKAYKESKKGTTVVCLIPCRTDTNWWNDIVIKGNIYFLKKRLKFKGSNNMAPFPCAVVIFWGNILGDVI